MLMGRLIVCKLYTLTTNTCISSHWYLVWDVQLTSSIMVVRVTDSEISLYAKAKRAVTNWKMIVKMVNERKQQAENMLQAINDNME